jgi:hypothetical protein
MSFKDSKIAKDKNNKIELILGQETTIHISKCQNVKVESFIDCG